MDTESETFSTNVISSSTAIDNKKNNTFKTQFQSGIQQMWENGTYSFAIRKLALNGVFVDWHCSVSMVAVPPNSSTIG